MSCSDSKENFIYPPKSLDYSDYMKKVMKGQGALEYLMTYGWALLVIVVVAAALFALGVLNPATYQQKRCNGFQYFTYVDQRLTASNFTLQLQNSNQVITLTQVSVAADTPATFTVQDADGNFGATVQAGEKFVVWADGGWVPVPALSQGDSYDDVTVTVTYDVSGGITGSTDRATCVGTVQ